MLACTKLQLLAQRRGLVRLVRERERHLPEVQSKRPQIIAPHPKPARPWHFLLWELESPAYGPLLLHSSEGTDKGKLSLFYRRDSNNNARISCTDGGDS